VVGADHPQGGVLLHHPPALQEPGARERVVIGKARELVPVVVNRIDDALIGARQRVLELQVIGRIGEDEVDALGRQALERGDAIAEDDLIEWKGRTPHPRRRRGPPGTRDLDPGGGAGGPGTRGTHG
jgi:hypothetical protein